MIIQKFDLFKDIGQEAMKKISKVMVEESYEKGSVLYKAGDPAINLYLIVDGSVTLSVGTAGKVSYTAHRPGEVFGWSSMVDRPGYVYTAECYTKCTLVRIEKEKLDRLMEEDPKTGLIFFKRLAGAVVQRLVDNYSHFLSAGSLSHVTYGSGQVTSAVEE